MSEKQKSSIEVIQMKGIFPFEKKYIFISEPTIYCKFVSSTNFAVLSEDLLVPIIGEEEEDKEYFDEIKFDDIHDKNFHEKVSPRILIRELKSHEPRKTYLVDEIIKTFSDNEQKSNILLKNYTIKDNVTKINDLLSNGSDPDSIDRDVKQLQSIFSVLLCNRILLKLMNSLNGKKSDIESFTLEHARTALSADATNMLSTDVTNILSMNVLSQTEMLNLDVFDMYNLFVDKILLNSRDFLKPYMLGIFNNYDKQTDVFDRFGVSESFLRHPFMFIKKTTSYSNCGRIYIVLITKLDIKKVEYRIFHVSNTDGHNGFNLTLTKDMTETFCGAEYTSKKFSLDPTMTNPMIEFDDLTKIKRVHTKYEKITSYWTAMLYHILKDAIKSIKNICTTDESDLEIFGDKTELLNKFKIKLMHNLIVELNGDDYNNNPAQTLIMKLKSGKYNPIETLNTILKSKYFDVYNSSSDMFVKNEYMNLEIFKIYHPMSELLNMIKSHGYLMNVNGNKKHPVTHTQYITDIYHVHNGSKFMNTQNIVLNTNNDIMFGVFLKSNCKIKYYVKILDEYYTFAEGKTVFIPFVHSVVLESLIIKVDESLEDIIKISESSKVSPYLTITYNCVKTLNNIMHSDYKGCMLDVINNFGDDKQSVKTIINFNHDHKNKSMTHFNITSDPNEIYKANEIFCNFLSQ